MDYSNAKIYRIISNESGMQYIGATTQTLSRALSKHKHNYNSYLKKTFSYVTVFDILEKDNYDIVLIEQVKDCENIEQLNKKKREYIETLECVNKMIPLRTTEEYNKYYYQKHKEELKKLSYDYYKQHKENKKIYNKDYNKDEIKPIICKCGGKFIPRNKNVHLKSEIHKMYLDILDSIDNNNNSNP